MQCIDIRIAFVDRGHMLNLLYQNANPRPATICEQCKPLIGTVWLPGSEPPLPAHWGCYCYYMLIDAPPTQWDWTTVPADFRKHWVMYLVDIIRRGVDIIPPFLLPLLPEAIELIQEEDEEEDQEPTSVRSNRFSRSATRQPCRHLLALTHNSTTADSEPPWGDVDKTRLPRNAHADVGNADDDGSPGSATSWKYPHHWVRNGVVGEDGVYTSGDMFLHRGGLYAAWAAAQGARSGQEASPAAKAHLQAHRSAIGAGDDDHAQQHQPNHSLIRFPRCSVSASFDSTEENTMPPTAPQSTTRGRFRAGAAYPDQVGPRQYEVILIEAGDNMNGWTMPEKVLTQAAPLFDNAPCLIDHAGFLDWPSLRDYAGYYTRVHQGATGSLLATLTLQDNEAGHFLTQVLDAWLDDREADLATPPIGLSADLTVSFSHDGEQRVATTIHKVWSVDAVLHPAAGGRVQRVLNSIQSSTPATAEGHPPGLLPTCRDGRLRPKGEYTMSEEKVTYDVGANPDGTSGDPRPPDQDSVPNRDTSPSPTPPQDALFGALQEQIAMLTGQVQELRSTLASQEAERTITGLGQVPRLQGMRSSLDQVEIALDAMLAGRRPPGDVPPLSGIRELYHLLSGDYEMTGVYQADRIYLAAVNCSTMAGLVANALIKRVVNEFQQYPQWWSPIVIVEDFSNLQDVRWITLGGVGELPTVAEGASYTELTWDDQTETDSFTKKGGYLGLTLEAIDKDDTSRIRSAPRALAQAAWLTLSKSVSAIFTANSGVGPTMSDSIALFNASHSNLGSTALSWSEYTAVRTAMRKQTELNSGERLGALTAPKYILVPPDLEVTALQILASEGQPGTANNDENVFAQGDAHNARMALARDRVIVVDLWTDTDNWAAVADPRLYPSIGIGYRYGRQPEIFSVASPTAGLMFSNDTMPIKVRYFYAVGPTDYRGLYKENV